MTRFNKSIKINCSEKKAFEFHTDTNNLKLITPPGINVEILSINLPLNLGSEIKLRVTQFGLVRTTWIIKLTEYIYGKIITDTQLSGPFSKWIHRHKFEGTEDTCTMTDEIEYELPFGALGRLADKVIVSSLIKKQFDYRHKATKQLLEGNLK